MINPSAFINKIEQGQIRSDFPILHQTVNQHPLVYFDNAATTQKPQSVIQAITDFYEHDNSNVHRGVHALSVRATQKYEAARETVRRFINANNTRECIFVRGTTEAINLVAQCFVAPRIHPGEEIIITQMEHHANIVPWQMICDKTGAKLRVVPIAIEGEVMLDEFEKMLSSKTKFVSIAHLPIDVQDLDCDFYAFSGHKMYAPTGIGVLWGRESLLDMSTPYQGGGEMINYVTFDRTEYAPLPFKFEAGTPNISGALGLAAAMDYLWSLDLEQIAAYEAYLLKYTTDAIQTIKGFNLIGTAAHKVPVISFVHGKIHAHDIGTILDSEGIAIRSGHHCAMPLMDFYDVAATSRVSLSFYNTKEEVDRLIAALESVKKVFA